MLLETSLTYFAKDITEIYNILLVYLYTKIDENNP